MNEEPVLVTIEEAVSRIKGLGKAYIILSGPEEHIIGTLNLQTMFVWTSRGRAEDFLKKNLAPADDKVREYALDEVISLARRLQFSVIRFDFLDEGAHPEQGFVNFRLDSQLSLKKTISVWIARNN